MDFFWQGSRRVTGSIVRRWGSQKLNADTEQDVVPCQTPDESASTAAPPNDLPVTGLNDVQEPSSLDEITSMRDMDHIYTDRAAPAFVWVQDGDHRCCAVLMTQSFYHDLLEAIQCIRETATVKTIVERRLTEQMVFRERLLDQLRIVEADHAQIMMVPNSDTVLHEVRQVKDKLMQLLSVTDQPGETETARLAELSTERDEIDGRIYEVFDDVFERAGLIPPFDIDVGSAAPPFQSSLLDSLERMNGQQRVTDDSAFDDQDSGNEDSDDGMPTSDQEHAEDMDAALAVQEPPSSDLFEQMMERRQHLLDMRSQLTELSACIENEQTDVDNLVLRLEASGIECPTGKDTAHVKDVVEAMLRHRDLVRQLEQAVSEDDLELEKARYEYWTRAQPLEAAGFDVVAAEAAHDREVLTQDLMGTVVEQHGLWKKYERFRRSTEDEKQRTMAYHESQRSVYLEREGGLDLIADDEEEFNADMTRWQIMADNAKAEFEAAVQRLEEAGMICPDFSTFETCAILHDDQESYGERDTAGQANVDMIKTLPGLHDIELEPNQLNRWRYGLGPFGRDAETASNADLEQWVEADIGELDDSLSVRVPAFMEKTDQKRLQQWQRAARRTRLDFDALRGDPYDGVA